MQGLRNQILKKFHFFKTVKLRVVLNGEKSTILCSLKENCMHIYVSDTENLSNKEEDSDFLGRPRHLISQYLH